jgi:hypothetical protein
LLATGDDFRYPETIGGQRNATTRLMHRYVEQVLSIANGNQHVFTTFFDVAQLNKPVTALFRPGILALVLKRALRPM